MKKNLKRWLALMLAITLVAMTGLHSSRSWLRANEDGQADETQQVQENTVEQVEVPPQETPPPQVETPAPPQEEPKEIPKEEPKETPKEEPKADAPKVQAEEPKKEAEAEPQVEEKKTEPAKKMAAAPKKSQPKEYTVTVELGGDAWAGDVKVGINKTALEKVERWGNYSKQFAEGTPFYIQAKVSSSNVNNYQVDKVTANGKRLEKTENDTYVVEVNADINIEVTYKQIDRNTYTLTFYEDGAASSGHSHTMTVIGKPFKFPTIEEAGFIREGYKLIGWKKINGNDGNKIYEPGTEGVASWDGTYYAVWEELPSTEPEEKEYTITFDANGGQGTKYTLETEKQEFEFPDNNKKTKFTKEGYEFIGWSENETGKVEHNEGEKLKTNSDKTYYAVWEKKKTVPKITFDPNGGSGKSYTIPTWNNGTFEFPNNETIGITKKDAIFVGWALSSKGDGEFFQPNTQKTGITKDTTYYAIWLDDTNDSKDAWFYIRCDDEIKPEPATYPNGDYLPKGAESNLNKGSIKKQMAINNNLSAVAANIKTTPYIEKILDKGGKPFNPETQKVVWYVIKLVQGRWHVDGVIRDKAKYTVTYNSNGGNNGTTYPGEKTYSVGQKVNVEFQPLPEKAGYKFIGWDTNPQAGTATYKSDGNKTFTMPDENVTLYAVWEATDGTEYFIDYYLEQNDGTFKRDKTDKKTGYTGKEVTIDIKDTETIKGYVCDKDVKGTLLTGTITAGEPKLKLKLYYRQIHDVKYDANLPEGTLYTEDGKEIGKDVELKVPEPHKGLKSGTPYTLKEYEDIKEVYTHDEYGNKNGKYTFNGWDKADDTMGYEDVIVKGTWTYKDLSSEIKKWKITYNWGTENIPNGETLPTDSTEYINNQSYTIDPKYSDEYVVPKKDDYGNTIGEYKFSGWDKEAGEHITGNIEVKGSWTYTETTLAKYNVTYEWNGLPPVRIKLYEKGGTTPITLNKPASITELVKGQPYTLTDMQGTKVYTHDEFGNENAEYTLGAWEDDNNGVMGEANVTVMGTWTQKAITVDTWKITYQWDDTAPTGTYAQNVPTDSKEYKNNEPYAVDKTFAKGKTVPTYDEFNNVNGQYVFNGWNTEDGNIKENLTITGTWTFTKTDVAAHNVTYKWKGLPNETLYDVAGNPTVPSVPTSITGLVKGQSYDVDKSMPGTEVYTHDAYGNKNGKYTLGSWVYEGTTTPVNAENAVMGEADVTITGTWTPETITLPEYEIIYKWGGDVPTGDYEQTLPTDSSKYVNNQPYEVDKNFGSDFAITTYDAHQNVNGKYTFSGWDITDGNFNPTVTTDGILTITGTWTFTETKVETHNVTYAWKGLPNETLYDAAGNVVTPSVPSTIPDLVNNQPYTVDRSLENTVVYTHDGYGNNTASYTLGTWNDPNSGKMGTEDVHVEAEWEKADITVPTYGITYKWSGDVPTGDYAQTLPEDTTVYKNNQPYAVDKTFAKGKTVTTYDEFENVNGQYVFNGWNTEDGNIKENLTITGTWTFTKTDVAAHNVTYAWTGLPNAALYDAAGNPTAPSVPISITGLVKGQSYAVDKSMPGTIVYTYDAEGNTNAKYTLGAWADPNNGKMGDENVVIEAEWTKEEITAERTYNLSIYYMNTEGNAVADPYIGSFKAGEAFSVVSPKIDGFTPNYATINSDKNGMPARDLTFVVVYVANANVTPGTPGLPGIIPGTPPVVTPTTPTTPTTPNPAAPTPETPATPTTPTVPAAPTTPTAPTAPAAPATPAVVAAAGVPGTPLVEIPPQGAPLGVDGIVEEAEDGDYTLREIKDGETPLANKNLDNHDCCLLHFLLMLAAIIVEVVYTRNMKKRQAKIFELREELEIEKKKKELGENDDAQ